MDDLRVRHASYPQDAVWLDKPEVQCAFHGFLPHEIRYRRIQQEFLQGLRINPLPVIEMPCDVDLQFPVTEFLPKEMLVAGANDKVFTLVVDFDADHG